MRSKDEALLYRILIGLGHMYIVFNTVKIASVKKWNLFAYFKWATSDHNYEFLPFSQICFRLYPFSHNHKQEEVIPLFLSV